MDGRAHARAATPRRAGPIERVDPFDHPEHPLSALVPSAAEVVAMRLGRLRSRITELDAEVAGLLAQRDALERAALELAVDPLPRRR